MRIFYPVEVVGNNPSPNGAARAEPTIEFVVEPLLGELR